MRGSRVEVVTRPVEVDREKVDGIEAVLLPVRLSLHQQHLLGQPVGRVRLFGVAVPQVVFLERDGRELGVRTDRPDRDELLDAGEAGFLHQLGAHHQVVEEEGAGVFPVEADAAHPGRQMNHGVGALDDLTAAVALDQVEALRTRDEDIPAAMLAQPRNEARPKEAPATCHHDPTGHDRHYCVMRLTE